MILCAANMLNHLHLTEHGQALRRSVEDVIREGKVRTRDLGGYVLLCCYCKKIFYCDHLCYSKQILYVLLIPATSSNVYL